MRHYLAALLILVITATAFAGGGSKANKRIEVQNLGQFLLAVIVDPDVNIGFTDPDEFEAAGGKFLNTSEKAVFKVKEGQHIVAGAFIDGDIIGGDDAITVNVGSRTVKVVAVNVDPFLVDNLEFRIVP